MEKTYKQIAEELWDLLDSIDSLPDMNHPTTKDGYKKCCEMMVKRADKRHKLLRTDGFKLFLPK